MEIIYSNKITDTSGNKITKEVLKNAFSEAILINRELILNNKRIAYFFIDPLINSFEAANDFYFNVLECESISKINTYKSGASPIQALYDAKELIDHNIYDAVFIFGQDLLLSDMKNHREEAKKAMNIFEHKSLIECYNMLAERLCDEMGLTKDQFLNVSDILYNNYAKSYKENTGLDVMQNRGRVLTDINANLFKLTDCANPNIDFAGGIVVAREDVSKCLGSPIKAKIKVTGCRYNMVHGLPDMVDKILGVKENPFPHLKEAFLGAERDAKIDVKNQLYSGNLMLEVYTCYPPIPIGFLLSTGIIKDIEELEPFLRENSITASGGMNLARAPWNNPALSGMIDLCRKMTKNKVKYGLVHGNGGIGEVQGIAILELDEGM